MGQRPSHKAFFARREPQASVCPTWRHTISSAPPWLSGPCLHTARRMCALLLESSSCHITPRWASPRKPRPRPTQGSAVESTRKHRALCAKDGCSPLCLNSWGLSLAEHKAGGPLKGSRELGALPIAFWPQISETQPQTPFPSLQPSRGTLCPSAMLTCVSPSFPHRIPLMTHGDRWVSYLYVINI